MGVVLSTPSASVVAQRAGKAAAPIDPKADEQLKRMCACLASASQFSFRVHDTMDELVDFGQKIQFGRESRIALRRPDRLAVEVNGDLIDEQAWYDGRTVTLLDKRENSYGVIEVPGNIDAMLDYLAERFGVAMPLADLIFSDPYQTAAPAIRSGGYVGLHRVNGMPCHHLAFRQDTVDWQLWVDAGQQPVPRKLLITYKAMPGQPQYTAVFSAWNLSASLPDELFAFTPPAGAAKVDLKPVIASEAAGKVRIGVDTKEAPGPE
jgi:hypothetical protein